ncbi:hypothetical protein PENTCL1PPCAC_20313, partial [Pristionchus entomophagus]
RNCAGSRRLSAVRRRISSRFRHYSDAPYPQGPDECDNPQHARALRLPARLSRARMPHALYAHVAQPTHLTH